MCSKPLAAVLREGLRKNKEIHGASAGRQTWCQVTGVNPIRCFGV